MRIMEEGKLKKTADNIDWVLLVFLVFLGWFGIDKFWIKKCWKGTWKFAFAKLISNLALVGIIWNIWDIVMACNRTYQYDAREYFA